MSLFVIGDTHLSLAVNKPMDIFGGWDNYVDRLKENWQREVSPGDTVVIPGDISWAMNFREAEPDFRFLHELNGKKIIMKGNHDYWWNTMSKMNSFLSEHGFDSISIVHNNCEQYGQYGICGTRGWINDNTEPADAKVLAREAIRLDASIKAAKEKGLIPVVFLHYPPVYGNECNYDILDVLYKHEIDRCFYGHIHGKGCSYAVNGVRDGIDFRLISSDYMQFCPYKIM